MACMAVAPGEEYVGYCWKLPQNSNEFVEDIKESKKTLASITYIISFTIHFHYSQQYLILLFTTVFNFSILLQDLLWLARPTATNGVLLRRKNLLSTRRMLNYIVSEVAKFFSLDVLRQVYMGHFLIVFPGSSTRREHFSTATRFSFQRHTA